MDVSLRIASYNIGAGTDWSSQKDEDGKLPVSIPKIAGVIASMNPDLCGLQEVYYSGPAPCYTDQAKQIADRIGGRCCAYARGERFDWGDEIGNAVLSRFPILSHREFPVLKPDESERRSGENNWYEDRVLLETLIGLPEGRKLLFCTAHFGLNLLERERMVRVICERLDQAEYPVILTGDFNASPDSPELAPLYARMKNAAALLGNTDFTHASFDPARTLDYIFVSGELVPVSFTVPSVIVSDHLPVVAELKWRA